MNTQSLDSQFSDLPTTFLSDLTLAFKKLMRELDEIFQNPRPEIEVSIKEDNSKVTNYDLMVEERINTYLEDNYPFPIISEENHGKNPTLGDSLTWVVDPIDGTSSFINGRNSYSVMIGLLKDKKPIWGMVYLPAYRKGYYALKNPKHSEQCGSFLFTIDNELNDSNNLKDDQRLVIEPAPETRIKPRTIVMNKKHLQFHPWEKELMKLFKIEDVINLGSIGIKLSLIAEGKAHYYFNVKSHFGIWDLAAPILILEEAGGKAVNTRGEDIIFASDKTFYPEGLIAAERGELHSNLPLVTETLQSHLPKNHPNHHPK